MIIRFDVNKVISIAKAEIGYLEKASNKNLEDKTANAGSNNYTKYGDYFGINGPSGLWCDMFVDWCFVQAYGREQAKKMIGGFSAYTPTSAQYYKNMARYYKTPAIGDQIFFKNASRICHTGLVYKVSGQKVYTIEGNTSGASGVIANGGGVCKKSYDLNNARIAGYGRPAYDGVTETSATKTTDSRIDSVREVQHWLNQSYASGLSEDNAYGPKTKRALVKALQRGLGGLTVDGIWGPKTKARIKVLKRGNKGTIVKVLQALLVCNGYPSAYADGDFGTGTESAVRAFQSKKKISCDGQAGKQTFEKLCA